MFDSEAGLLASKYRICTQRDGSLYIKLKGICRGKCMIFCPATETGVCVTNKVYRGKVMITVTNIRNVDHTAYDEVWAIVRSLKNPGNLKHVPGLSPSWELFRRYLDLRNTGRWNTEAFQGIYVPTFLKEMQTATARKKLNELVWLDRQGRRIALACFCSDEATCHRSIVAGILQHAGVRIQGVKRDYSPYGRLYFGREIEKRNPAYRMKSLKQLLDGYAFEVGRRNQADKEATQRRIMDEVYARIKDTFKMLEVEPEAIEQIYEQLIEH